MTLSTWLRAAPRGMLIGVVIAFAFLNGLGIWQLYRLHWKEGLIADMARTEEQAPVPINTLLSPGSVEPGKGDCPPEQVRGSCAAPERTKIDWRSASLPLCNIDAKSVIYMHSEVDAVPGYRVLTACPLVQGQPLMLVDLGFTTDKLKLDSAGFTPVGRLRPADKSSAFSPVNRPADHDWYTRSTVELGKAWDVPLRSDYFLVLDLKRSHLDIAGLQQGALTAPLPNRHFEYALTWFGLAWAMIGIFIAFVTQRTKGITGLHE